MRLYHRKTYIYNCIPLIERGSWITLFYKFSWIEQEWLMYSKFTLIQNSIAAQRCILTIKAKLGYLEEYIHVSYTWDLDPRKKLDLIMVLKGEVLWQMVFAFASRRLRASSESYIIEEPPSESCHSSCKYDVLCSESWWAFHEYQREHDMCNDKWCIAYNKEGSSDPY